MPARRADPTFFVLADTVAEQLAAWNVPRKVVNAVVRVVVEALHEEASAAARALDDARQYELGMGARTVAARLELILPPRA